MTSKGFLNPLQRLIWFIGIFVITCPVARVRAQDKPRLRDFGSSLKKHSQKNPSESQKSNVDDDVVRVQTDLVVCDVMIVNKQGNAIPGLERNDFTVSEEGIPQQIGTFSLGDDTKIPRSIVLILDHSRSQAPYIKTSVEAAKVLVDKLGPKDRMALVTDDVKLLADFTSNKDLLKEKLNSVKNSDGQSRQYSALMATLNEMFNSEDIRPIVIFQTDGDQLGSLKDGNHPNTSFSFRDVVATVEKSRASIYSIIPGPSLFDLTPTQRAEKIRSALPPNVVTDEGAIAFGDKRFKEQLSIASLARLSGGWPDFLEKPELASEVYARIFADINNRYVIGYYPTNKTRDGKQRNIQIEVRGHPEYIVWGRKTYFAPED
jgi:Ca-activated chloride channel homolog